MTQKKPDRWEKMVDKFIPVTESGCWIWLASGDGRYGQVQWNGKWRKAHRVAYEVFKGCIPQGLVLDHLCRVTCCVNPDHLEAVTIKENNARGFSPMTMQSHQTHCKRGHEFNPVNTKVRKDGSRNCRICTRNTDKKYRDNILDQLKRRAI